MKTIIFDHDCAGWCVNRDVNVLFLEQQRCYLVEKLLNRGYVYLNEVYEALGAKWDPR